MRLFGESEIERCKRQARAAFSDMERIGDEMDCGHALACFISSRYRGAKERYDTAVARLREIDPTFPKESANVPQPE